MDNQIQAMIESFRQSHALPSIGINPERYRVLGDICPYFTPDEIAKFEGYYSDKSDEDCTKLYEGYVGNHHDTKKNEFSKSWLTKINDLQNQLMSTEDPDAIDQIKQNMIALGWNPEIEYNVENQIKAKKRFESIMNEKYNRLNVVNMVSTIEVMMEESIEESKKEGKKLYPIHIVLVKGDAVISKVITTFTDGEFSHAAISLDNKLEKLYSFNFANKFNIGGGFSLESIKEYPKNNRLAVYTIFVTEQAYKKISENIQYLLDNIKKTGYSVVNLILFPFKNIKINMSDNMICSQFVDSILKMANVNVVDDDSSKVSPNKLYFATKNNPKAYKVFDGVVKDFDHNKVEKFLNKLSKTAISANESGLYEEAIYEARKIPIEINADGDVLLTNPFPNYYEEYLASHRLLLNYEKTGNIEAMKYELSRLYYMNYIIEKKLYHNKNLHRKTENIKVRAKILNDFNKYLKYVNSREKNFNFSEYYEASPFYPHTVEIKSSTIGQIKDIINYIL